MSAKRSRSDEEEIVDKSSKRCRIINGDQEKSTATESSASLISLSDPVLLLILQYLSTHDIVSTSETCLRLQRICDDKTLWRRADFRGRPLSLKPLKTLVKKLKPTTDFLAVEGSLYSGPTPSKIETFSEVLLRDLTQTCPNLTTIVLHKCYIDAEKVTFSRLPPSLEQLAVTHCEVVNTPEKFSYFKEIHTNLPRLKSLDLTGAGWVSNHSLMAICKCPLLEELRLRGCFRIGECFAYTALATRFGFENVKFFDLRDTEIGDSEVACFGRRPRVEVLLVGTSGGRNENSKISDRAVINLFAEPLPKRLKRVSFRGTKLSDAGLVEMVRLSQLELLDVRETNVTREWQTLMRMVGRVHGRVVTDFEEQGLEEEEWNKGN